MSDSGNIKVSQVRGNFNRIARDLDRALSVAGFNATEAFLIARARELSWPHHAADGEPQPFAINLSEAARLLKTDRKWLRKSHAALVAAKVFVEAGTDRFHINKDYRQWLTTEGAMRLTSDQIAYCMEVAKAGRGGVKTPQGGGVNSPQAHGVKTPQGTDVLWGENTPGGGVKTPQGGGVNSPQSGDPPLTSPPEIQREERDREKSDVGRAHAGPHADAIGHAGAHAREDVPRPAPDRSAPAYPSDPAAAPDTIALGKHPEDPEWAAEFWGKLWAAFGQARVLWDFYRHQRWYSRECWEAALRKAVRQGTRVERGLYLERIAAEFDAHGVPADEPPKPRPRFNPIVENRKAVSAILRGEKQGGRS